MHRGSMAQTADVKAGLGINEESLQPWSWPVSRCRFPRQDSSAAIALEVLRDGREIYWNV